MGTEGHFRDSFLHAFLHSLLTIAHVGGASCRHISLEARELREIQFQGVGFQGSAFAAEGVSDLVPAAEILASSKNLSFASH